MTRRTVFVDTWAWVAMAATDDPAHAAAVELRRRLERDNAILVTSDLVLSESVTRLRYDQGLQPALALCDVVKAMVDSGDLVLVFIDETTWHEAVEWLRRYEDQRFSIADCASFAIMEASRISEALTADHHFATAGFTPLGS